MKEIWHIIENTNNKFSISNTGKIRNNLNNNILKGSIGRGYLRCCLSITGRNDTINLYIHQQVAKYFINNIFNKPFINHINGIKTDNRVENLEWVTARENQIHAYKIGLKKPKKGILNGMSKKVIDVNNGKIFNTMTEAAKEYGLQLSNFSKMLKGKRKNNSSLIRYEK